VCTWESGGGLCIEPENEDQLQHHPDQALAMCLNSRDSVVQHYDWNELARQYVAIIEQHASLAKAAETMPAVLNAKAQWTPLRPGSGRPESGLRRERLGAIMEPCRP